MTLDDRIRELVLGAVREALQQAIRDELARPRMIPIKAAPIGYRQLLDAEKRDELVIYRVGHASLVDEGELYSWIRRAGAPRKAEPEPADEIAQVVEFGDDRRARRRRPA